MVSNMKYTFNHNKDSYYNYLNDVINISSKSINNICKTDDEWIIGINYILKSNSALAWHIFSLSLSQIGALFINCTANSFSYGG